MIFLPDVNVWIALTSNRHVHHARAEQWLQTVDRDQIAFCRISELGFLRLLTNSHVMQEDVLPAAEAWHVYGELRLDDRVIFLSEGAHFSEQWRRTSERIVTGPNEWTDAYLAAFALHAEATVVTLDRTFPILSKGAIKTLS